MKAGAGLVDRKVAERIISMGPELVSALARRGIELAGSNGDGGGMEGDTPSGVYSTTTTRPAGSYLRSWRTDAGRPGTSPL